MPKSLSILTIAAALGLAGAAYAQDTSTDTDAAADTVTDTATDTATDAATDSAADTATEEAATDTDTATEEAAEGAADADADATGEAADDAAAEGTAEDDKTFSTGKEVGTDQPAVYIKEKFGDWNLRCFRNADGEDPCQLYQLLREAGGNPIAEFSVFRIEGQAPAVAGATAIVPLVTLLTEELKLSVDGGTAKSYPYRVCTEAGCVAQIGFTAEDIAIFKKGNKAQFTLVPAQAPDQKVKIDVSLSGFTAGYEAVAAFTE
ncbi:invasion associated locus B family protein [Roseovarius sp. Pro17]|uniref:invasion associated locus B family protein n=1 Tax=Roseovarius sp. Pro17 TaxID=3108175 RepID=UPI002D7941E1|nr:invasion associated locus B family protein [Roseovarius sp. Pro17]